MLPKRLTKPRRVAAGRVNQNHRRWVRMHKCCVPGCENGDIEFAHIRLSGASALRGGTGIKPGDDAGISLCGGIGNHHWESHVIGQRSFDAKYGIDSVALAQEFAAKSPHLKKLGGK